jgi:NAD(P)-dependent dehydrogenase (short-subunit alcohol dehydrogenase family)
MELVGVVTGADRGLGYAICEGLLEKGWRVFAGQYLKDWTELESLSKKFPDRLDIISLDVGSTESVRHAAKVVAALTDHVDLLISNAGIISGKGELREEIDYEAMQRIYNINSLGPVKLVEAFLPLTSKGIKRLCFVSSEASSIAVCHRNGSFGYSISKTALNMAVKIMYNDLRKNGYTFRLYQPGWMKTYMGGVKSSHGDMEPEESAAVAISQFTEEREDEDRLVLMDYMYNEWPF